MKSTHVLWIGVLLLSLASASSRASTPPEVLRNLKGCFEVTFRFVEDGTHDLDLRGGLFERVDFESKGEHLSFPHKGVIDGQLYKHWSEEWWANADGTWSQKVVGPYGDLRYECAAAFHFNQWSCTVAHAPKPRRDRERKDYDYLERRTTLQITPSGWTQVENNTKHTNDGTAVSNEVGWNEYKRVDDAKCKGTSAH